METSQKIQYQPISDIQSNASKKTNKGIYFFGFFLLLLGLIITGLIVYKTNSTNIIGGNNNKEYFYNYEGNTFDTNCNMRNISLCTYVNTLRAFFTISDYLRQSTSKTDLTDTRIAALKAQTYGPEKAIYDNGLYVFLLQVDLNNDNMTSVYSTNNFLGMQWAQDIMNDADNKQICETSSMMDANAPQRLNISGNCLAWVKFDQYIAVIGKLRIGTDDNDGYILFGASVRYVLNNVINSNEVKQNAGDILGNALFFIGIKEYEIWQSSNPKSLVSIWDAISIPSIYPDVFQRTVMNYKYYVFVARYNDGIRVAHESNTSRNTPSTLNDQLRVGADYLYGKEITYQRDNGEKKDSYVIGPYPNGLADGYRYSVGSGYPNDMPDSTKPLFSRTSMIAVMVVSVFVAMLH